METRAYLAGAASSPPAAPTSPSLGHPTTGVPGLTPATEPGPYWFYQIQEELRNIILSAGMTPDQSSLTQLVDAMKVMFATVSQVRLFATSTVPTGFLKANGAAVSRTTYAALFAKIGTTFGAGDGSTTFNLPDGRGEFFRGWDDGRGVDAGRSLGSWQGGQMPWHAHGTRTNGEGGSSGLTGWLRDNFNGAGPINGATEGAGGTDNGSENRPRNLAFMVCIKY